MIRQGAVLIYDPMSLVTDSISLRADLGRQWKLRAHLLSTEATLANSFWRKVIKCDRTSRFIAFPRRPRNSARQ